MFAQAMLYLVIVCVAFYAIARIVGRARIRKEDLAKERADRLAQKEEQKRTLQREAELAKQEAATTAAIIATKTEIKESDSQINTMESSDADVR